MTGQFHDFYNHWHKNPYGSNLYEWFPYTLPLEGLAPMEPDGTLNNEIVVTKAYHDMYYHILDLCKKSVG